MLIDIPEEERDQPVLYACDYGDYHHTTQVLGINNVGAAPQRIQEEAYSHSGWGLPKEQDEDEDPDDEGPDEDEDNPGPTAYILS